MPKYSRLEFPIANKERLKKAAEVVEHYVNNPGKAGNIIAMEMGTDAPFVSYAISYYFSKPIETMVLQSKINEEESVLTVY